VFQSVIIYLRKSSSNCKLRSVNKSFEWFLPIRRLKYGCVCHRFLKLPKCLVTLVVPFSNGVVLLCEISQRYCNFRESGYESSEKLLEPKKASNFSNALWTRPTLDYFYFLWIDSQTILSNYEAKKLHFHAHEYTLLWRDVQLMFSVTVR
jgi:hypothetical protein